MLYYFSNPRLPLYSISSRSHNKLRVADSYLRIYIVNVIFIKIRFILYLIIVNDSIRVFVCTFRYVHYVTTANSILLAFW